MTSDRAAHIVSFLFTILSVAVPASAQAPLTLDEAVRRAKAHNPDAEAAAALEREAVARVSQARGGYLPRVELAESAQLGNNPGFVFGALLAQRRITPAAFTVDALTHPGAASSFHAALSIEQPLVNLATSANVRAASIGREMAALSRQLVHQELTSAVTEAFGQVLIAAAAVRSTSVAVATARADRERAANRRNAGRVTDADVLQLDVYVARTLERQVQAVSDERVARARLNQLMGEPLSASFALDLTPGATAIDIANPAALEYEAVQQRPEVALARQHERLAAVAVDAAKASRRPQVAVQGEWDLNGDGWDSRASSWVVGAVARITLFQGNADRARVSEARQQTTRRSMETRKAETMVRLDVQIAIARIEAARASDAASQRAAEWARASHRIIQDRYESGLADVATLLRSADAVQQAEAQQTAAVVNVLIAGSNLQRAIGKS